MDIIKLFFITFFGIAFYGKTAVFLVILFCFVLNSNELTFVQLVFIFLGLLVNIFDFFFKFHLVTNLLMLFDFLDLAKVL